MRNLQNCIEKFVGKEGIDIFILHKANQLHNQHNYAALVCS